MPRQRIHIEGIVQGVGFRPFVFRLAARFGVAGWVRNDSRGVTIEAEAGEAALAAFTAALREEKPPLATITRLECRELPVSGEPGFAILDSRADQAARAQVPADAAVCGDCLAELRNPADRRFRYPFINCTNCGPRLTIITGIPYDRPQTTMAAFAMCPACLAEYRDPASRRFHAQPNACPVCGPRLSLVDGAGRPYPGDPLVQAVRLLREGAVVAIKGLGGYHLAVDAVNAGAVRLLRRRKRRDEKPFAVMAADLAAVEQFAAVSTAEATLIEGVERPIVLLEKLPDFLLAGEVAPGNRYVGVMLPYTPLHHLLLEEDFLALVMTSANLSDEPIAYRDEDARLRLTGIADAFLMHDRPIHTRVDDSVARVRDGRALLLRRSRGYVPRSIPLPGEQVPVLAVGAELKNTVCLTRGDRAFLSQHLGDLKNVETGAAFAAAIAQLCELVETRPVAVAHDLHPDYLATRYALEQERLPAVAVQHHHAHMASCLVENRCEEPAIGVIFDGLGYGADGTLWGGEFLAGDLDGCERVGHFRYLPLPGGDLAALHPWRMALSYLLAACGDELPELDCLAAVPAAELALVRQALARGINAPLASSCGRLFDAVAAIVGLRNTVSFEGQAAMELEMIADPEAVTPYPFGLNMEADGLVFDPRPLVRALVEAVSAGEAAARCAGRFHATLAEMVRQVCLVVRARRGLDVAVLSGGVFQNALLTTLVRERLMRAGFTVLTHSLVPPNDGGIALGQAAVAGRRLRGGVRSPASATA
ncbi:MAG: carbamoyltransferase HypF [Deltaproteobacteria bacterium]|nr:MAG: carbamoyltransferase HypF [Deltaproteobacteria bacterium]